MIFKKRSLWLKMVSLALLEFPIQGGSCQALKTIKGRRKRLTRKLLFSFSGEECLKKAGETDLSQ